MHSSCMIVVPCIVSFLLAFHDGVVAFGLIPLTRHHRIPFSSPRCPTVRLFAKKDGDKSSPNNMEDAFRQLEELISLDNDNLSPLPERKKKQDDAFAKAMQELNLKDVVEDKPEATIESEAALYKDMAVELSETTETDLIDIIKTDLGGTPTVMPKFDPTTRDTEKFMEQALDQALKEAEKQAQMDIDKESLLDNKEIMKEIEKIFEKANAELLEGIEEMRKEQVR